MADDRDVCVITHPLSAAGENATRTLLKILSTITTVSLITADLPRDSTIRDRYEVVEVSHQGSGDSIPIAAARFIRNQIRMTRAVWRRDEEVALFFGATAYLLPILAAKATGKTVILEPRGNVPLTLRLSWEQRVPSSIARLLTGLLWTLEQFCYHIADVIVTYTPAMATELGLDTFENKLYPHGARYVDTEIFAPERPLEERDRIVGFVGRLDEEKCVRELAAAAKELPDDIRFRFVGDGPLREELERELAPLVDEGHVEFVGWVDHDDVPKELNDLQLLVSPSQPTEGLPTTILESMACGTPVLATPVSGVPDVVRDGETGFYMNSREPQSIRKSIVSALNSEDLVVTGAAARELILEEYSFDAAVERYRTMLNSFDSS